jgi:TolB protein
VIRAGAIRAGLGALCLWLTACGDARQPSAAPGAEQAARDASRLPGTIWFVDDGPPRTLVRLAAGARREWTRPDADLYPMARLAPGGVLVAIASRGDGGPDAEQLALVPPHGEIARIGPAAPLVRSPAVDPRGRWIVVAASPDGHSDLYRIDLATAATTRLTSDRQGNFAPAVLGGDAIVFVSSRDGDAEIYRMAAAGGPGTRLTAFHRDDWQPAASPDGAAIAFTSDREGAPRIFVMAADGTGQRRLTSRTEPDAEESDPVWSPDGRSIAYLVRRPREARVWVRDVATGRERALTPPGVRDAEAAWAPDAAWILVSRGDDHQGELWAMPLTGGEAVRIAAGKSAHLPRWW